MSKKRRRHSADDLLDAGEFGFLETVTSPAAVAKKAEPLLTFDRWFATLGRPAHHKAGMSAHVSGKVLRGKRSVPEWEKLFATY